MERPLTFRSHDPRNGRRGARARSRARRPRLSYQRLLAWMRSFGEVGRGGVEGTGTYGVNLAWHLREQQVPVI